MSPATIATRAASITPDVGVANFCRSCISRSAAVDAADIRMKIQPSTSLAVGVSKIVHSSVRTRSGPDSHSTAAMANSDDGGY